AWLRGLKTTYYLRTVGATQAEKSTVKSGALNAVPMSDGAATDAVAEQAGTQLDAAAPASDVKFCSIDNPDCEACQ
ncbi:MAG TPA: hypothetical protein VFU71_14270, partial [Burkholderiaceae bacterium]|nr:hypothetical protein [Burkholderiaceae bacterium]